MKTSMAGLIKTMHLQPSRMAAQIKPELLATDLADYLVKQGIPFRQAHNLVGQAVLKATEKGVLLDLPISRRDLGEMTGTTLYTVSRILSGWEQLGLIETGRERIIIRTPHDLVIIAEDLPAEHKQPRIWPEHVQEDESES